MTFDKIFDAYKEAILLSVDKREYDKVDILNTSMKLLSESLNSNPVVKSKPTINKENIYASSILMQEFILQYIGNNSVSSTKVTTAFFDTYHTIFTDYDFEKNAKGDPRWKTRFWNVAFAMRKAGVLMPNSGKFTNRYCLNKSNTAQN
jgi:hypothetical protein